MTDQKPIVKRTSELAESAYNDDALAAIQRSIGPLNPVQQYFLKQATLAEIKRGMATRTALEFAAKNQARAAVLEQQLESLRFRLRKEQTEELVPELLEGLEYITDTVGSSTVSDTPLGTAVKKLAVGNLLRAFPVADEEERDRLVSTLLAEAL